MPGLDGRANKRGYLDGGAIELPAPLAVDGGRHDEVGWDVDFKAGVDCDEVGGALLVLLGGFAGLEVTVDVVFVREDAGLMVFLGYGLVCEIGSSSRLR